MRSRIILPVLIVPVMTCTSLGALAATWYVEKDGSGDYSVIQDAVEVAASGDTIQIGPGRFDDKVYATSVGWSDSVRVLVTQDELTIIGSGPETIIGQDYLWASDQGRHKGIVASDYWGNTQVHIGNIRFENMRDAIYVAYEFAGADSADIKGCEFSQNLYSLFLIGDGGGIVIENCGFYFMQGSGRLVFADHFGSFHLRDSIFQLSSDSPISQSCVGIQSVQSADIEGCQFIDGYVGVSVSLGGRANIFDCVFDGQKYNAINPSIAADVSVDSCMFRRQDNVMESSSGAQSIVMTNSAVEDVADCSFLFFQPKSVVINNCDLAAGSRGVVYLLDNNQCANPIHMDMTGNYWGTADEDSIRNLIRDYTDDVLACDTVEFLPFSGTKVPAEKNSLGGVKALFR